MRETSQPITAEGSKRILTSTALWNISIPERILFHEQLRKHVGTDKKKHIHRKQRERLQHFPQALPCWSWVCQSSETTWKVQRESKWAGRSAVFCLWLEQSKEGVLVTRQPVSTQRNIFSQTAGGTSSRWRHAAAAAALSGGVSPPQAWTKQNRDTSQMSQHGRKICWISTKSEQ